jgi:hypothetical protein
MVHALSTQLDRLHLHTLGHQHRAPPAITHETATHQEQGQQEGEARWVRAVCRCDQFPPCRTSAALSSSKASRRSAAPTPPSHLYEILSAMYTEPHCGARLMRVQGQEEEGKGRQAGDYRKGPRKGAASASPAHTSAHKREKKGNFKEGEGGVYCSDSCSGRSTCCGANEDSSRAEVPRDPSAAGAGLASSACSASVFWAHLCRRSWSASSPRRPSLTARRSRCVAASAMPTLLPLIDRSGLTMCFQIYNSNLEKLSEHYDIPKVSWTK